jgi:hypothetical protein
MARHQWKALNKQQVGTYAEYFVKMELTMHGFQVYSTEVDDRGIDFVARHQTGPFIEIQVKSLRSTGYVFMEKSKFPIRDGMHLALVLFIENEAPRLYLIPATVWNTPNKAFVSRDYGAEGQTSKPEWGINLSMKNLPILAQYEFDTAISSLT